MSKKLRKKLIKILLDVSWSLGGPSGTEDIEKASQALESLIAKEKRELADKMIACVGTMDFIGKDYPSSSIPMQFSEVQTRNELRTQIRTAMDKVMEENE